MAIFLLSSMDQLRGHQAVVQFNHRSLQRRSRLPSFDIDALYIVKLWWPILNFPIVFVIMVSLRQFFAYPLFVSYSSVDVRFMLSIHSGMQLLSHQGGRSAILSRTVGLEGFRGKPTGGMLWTSRPVHLGDYTYVNDCPHILHSRSCLATKCHDVANIVLLKRSSSQAFWQTYVIVVWSFTRKMPKTFWIIYL